MPSIVTKIAAARLARRRRRAERIHAVWCENRRTRIRMQLRAA